MNLSDNVSDWEESSLGFPMPICKKFREASLYHMETAIAITITSILGLFGNFLSGVVLRMPQMRTIHSLFLCMLTLSDSLQLLMFLIFFGFPVFGLKYNPIYTFPYFAKVLVLVGYSTLTSSTYLTVLLTVERYKAVCIPHSIPLFPTRKRMLSYVAVILVFSILFNLVRWWETIPCQRGNHIMLESSSLSEDFLYNKLYTFMAKVLINFLIPFLILSVLNVFIYRGMVAADKRKRKISVGRHLHDSTITLMLIVVVAVFCVCNMFHTVSHTVSFFCKDHECYSVDVLNQLQIYLYSFNASVNFLIYCFCGRKFRKQLLALFGYLRGSNSILPTSSTCRNQDSIRTLTRNREKKMEEKHALESSSLTINTNTNTTSTNDSSGN